MNKYQGNKADMCCWSIFAGQWIQYCVHKLAPSLICLVYVDIEAKRVGRKALAGEGESRDILHIP